MILRATFALGALLAPPDAGILQCREITEATYVETRHANGAVSTARAAEGEKFVVMACTPEGNRVWCYVMSPSHTLFTVQRFLDVDRLGTGRSMIIAFDACLSPS